MTEPHRTILMTSAINAARTAFAGAIVGCCAMGFAAQAGADSPNGCNPFYLSMTPQPVLACVDPDPAAPVDAAPVSDAVNDGISPPPAEPAPPGDPLLPQPSDP